MKAKVTHLSFNGNKSFCGLTGLSFRPEIETTDLDYVATCKTCLKNYAAEDDDNDHNNDDEDSIVLLAKEEEEEILNHNGLGRMPTEKRNKMKLSIDYMDAHGSQVLVNEREVPLSILTPGDDLEEEIQEVLYEVVNKCYKYQCRAEVKSSDGEVLFTCNDIGLVRRPK